MKLGGRLPHLKSQRTFTLPQRRSMGCRCRQPQRAVVVGQGQGQAAQWHCRRKAGPQLRQGCRCSAARCQALRGDAHWQPVELLTWQ